MQKNKTSSSSEVVDISDENGQKAIDLQLFFPYRMLISTDQVTKLFELHYRERFGITIPESRILNVLSRDAFISSREICEMTAMTKPRVSTAIARMVAAGLVTRSLEDDDRRLLRLELTPRGKALHRKVARGALEIERALIEEMSDETRDIVVAFLRSIEKRARDLIENFAGRGKA